MKVQGFFKTQNKMAQSHLITSHQDETVLGHERMIKAHVF